MLVAEKEKKVVVEKFGDNIFQQRKVVKKINISFKFSNA